MSEVFNTLSLDQLEALLDENGIIAKREQSDDRGFLRFNAGLPDDN